MDGVTITRHDQGDRGEYQAAVSGSAAIGRLTYVRTGDVLAADHTIVPPAIGGRGIAAELVRALVADARANGWKIRPVCSYVVAMFQRHPEWADLRA